MPHDDCPTCQERKLATLREALLVQATNLLERATCSLLPDMEDTPTALDEVRQAQSLLFLLLENGQ